MVTDPARRRQAAASALWIPIGFGVGSFAIAGAREGHHRVIDRAASVRGMAIACLAACAIGAVRWRFGETRREADFRRLFAEPHTAMERAARVAGEAFVNGAASVAGSALALWLGSLTSSQRRPAVPGFAPRRLPVAIFEASVLMGGGIVAVIELARAVRLEAQAQPRLRRAHALWLPREPAIIAPGTAEEAFGDLSRGSDE